MPRPLRARFARPARLRLIGAVAALAVGAAMLATPTTAVSSANATFHPRLITVDTPFRSDKERLQTLGLDLTEHAGHDYVEVVIHSAAELDLLKRAKFTYQVQIRDLIRRGIKIAELNEDYAASVKRSPLPSGRDTYRTLADYNADMTRLEKKHPGLVDKFELKRPSLDGRTIYGVEIGGDVRRPDSGRPTFVLLGVHHAREWPSGELAMEFAFDLVKNYGTGERITRLLHHARVIVVPVVNVDGFELSRTDGEYSDLRELNPNDPLSGSTSVLATPGQTYKRKNCRVVDGEDTPDGSCRGTAASPGGFGIGVDLNRNYGGFWGGPGAAATEPNPSTVEGGALDPTYRGASAFSEPETKNIQDLISSRQTTMMISNHTFSNLVLRPNGVNPNTVGADGKPVGDSPDEGALKELGARMAAQNGYANIHGWQLYDTTGTTEDWSYNATGGFGYTFEIGPNEFHPPYPQVVDGEDTPDGSCRGTAASPGGYGIGVDLNRNYGGFWGGPGAAATEPNPGTVEGGALDPTYRGASAFSEPETKNIQDLISSRQTTMMISNHTFSNLVLRPNGVNPNTVGADGKPVGDSPDEGALKELGARMAAQNGYANIHGWQLYDTTGTTEDWSYNATGGFGYTFEIGPNEFHPPYPQVVDEYLGKGKYAGKGNREAYLIALQHAVDTRYSGILTGNPPQGATIRLEKHFRTPTWESSFADGVNSAITAGADGIEWIVNPSTRPVVRSHPYEDLSDKPFRKKVIEGGPIEPNSHRDHTFVLDGPADVFRTSLDWPTPDDLDLEVYRKTADGKKKVGSSGNFVGDKERVDLNGAPAGTYILRVINFASGTPSYTLTEELFDSVTRHTAGHRESYTMTCEKNGTVLQQEQVFIQRGETKRIDFSECRQAW